MKFTLIVSMLITSLDISCGAKILAFFAAPSQSHMNLKSALLRELATRGHHITAVSSFPEKTPIQNYTDIILKNNIDAFISFSENSNIYESEEEGGVVRIGFQSWHLNKELCKRILVEESIQKLIHSKDLTFDLLIIEAFFSDCFLPFAYKFKIPIIRFCTYGGNQWMGDWIGNPYPYSYVPDSFLNYSDRMSFWERLINTLTGTFFRLGRQFYYLPQEDSIVKELFNISQPLPDLSELDITTSLVLVNSHFSIGHPRPLLPNMIEVGGLHVKPPKKLPEDIQKYLDDAKHGAIFFSMGSILQSSKMPESKIRVFLQTFSQLKQRVLWKWETDTLPGQPDNVKLGKWLPQSDILAHPNLKLFITHGGLLSSQEALHRGVPILGIPIFADQRLNVMRAVRAGYGLMLRFNNVTTESLTWSIKEILQNPRYHEKAHEMSGIYRDQPLSPLEQAVFWTEYVIRHKGAPHMRSAALDLTWYQYFLLDVIVVLLLAITSVFLVTFLIFRAIFRKICSGGSQKLGSESKKKKRN